MVMNAPPTGGYVDASPRAGSAAVDMFSLQSLEWTDDIDDLPLLYSFAYTNNHVSESLQKFGGSLQNPTRGSRLHYHGHAKRHQPMAHSKTLHFAFLLFYATPTESSRV